MRSGQSRVEIEVVGLNQLKLLSFLNRSGIEIFDLKKQSVDVMVFKIRKNKLKLLKKIFKNKNINYQILSRSGFDGMIYFCIKNYGIFISLLFFIIFLAILSNFSFMTKIYGCSTLDESKIAAVVEQNMKECSFKKDKIDCDEIEKTLRNQFDTISFVSAIKRGCFVVVDIKEKLTNTETDKNLSQLSAKSSQKGYVSKIEIYQGTAAVRVGDFVDAGDILIHPYVLDSKGEKEFVVPRGKIELGCFFENTITHYDQTISFERTGKEILTYSLSLFGLEIYSHVEENPFDMFEEVESVQDLTNNNILPLKYVKKTTYELKEVIKTTNFEDEKQNYIEKAKQNVFQVLPESVIITNERQNIFDDGPNKRVQYVVEGKTTLSF